MPAFEVTFKSFFPTIPDLRDCPDAHISVLESDKYPGTYIWMWPNVVSRRSTGPTSKIEDQSYPDVMHGPVLKIYNSSMYCPNMLQKYIPQKRDRIDGGQWLTSVIKGTDRWIAILHSEDHFKDHYWDPNCDSVAWKSIDIAYSYDEGMSWSSTFVPILWDEKGRWSKNLNQKIDRHWWGGPGDAIIVRFGNQLRIYWADYTGIHIHASDDPLGAPGTWYYFATPTGLVIGASPSICFNNPNKMWVMVYHTWTTPRWTIRVAFSYDGIHWFEDRQIPNSESRLGGRSWMPTLIGRTDSVCDDNVRLYYSDCSEDSRGVCIERKFAVADAWIASPHQYLMPRTPTMTWITEGPIEITKSTTFSVTTETTTLTIIETPNHSNAIWLGGSVIGMAFLGLLAGLTLKRRVRARNEV
jgi:hypothetical protein